MRAKVQAIQLVPASHPSSDAASVPLFAPLMEPDPNRPLNFPLFYLLCAPTTAPVIVYAPGADSIQVNPAVTAY